jgi:hypothetical protein
MPCDAYRLGTGPTGADPQDVGDDGDAGWSSPVARQAHNLKVVGSNPTPATNLFNDLEIFSEFFPRLPVLCRSDCGIQDDTYGSIKSGQGRPFGLGGHLRRHYRQTPRDIRASTQLCNTSTMASTSTCAPSTMSASLVFSVQ